MKIHFDIKKGAEVVSGALEKASVIGGKVVSGVQDGAKDLTDKSKKDSYLRRLKKYNPLFPERYLSADFNVPNIVVIVDDAVRRGIDVCEGAIGWLDQPNGVEILYLYDEAIEMSGLQFVPAPVCDAIYCVDHFNRNRFIQVDSVFSLAHKERLAELEHVAFCLGAKRCSVEIAESDSQAELSHKKQASSVQAKIKGISVHSDSSCEEKSSRAGRTSITGRVESEFSGTQEIKVPELKWFRHDDMIKRLIEMRCKSPDSVKAKVLELEGSSSATMSKNAAIAIDSAVSKIAGAKAKASMEMQAAKEHRSTLLFRVEF